MKHETKLGLVFIGILLTIFVGLLMKRLARTGTAMLGHNQQPAASGKETPNKLAYQPAPPTLVTPKAQSGKPPESVVEETPNRRGDRYANTTKANRPESEPAATSEQPPLIATPSPVAEVGDRYSTKSHDPFDHSSETAAATPAAKPYRSAYADTADTHSDPRASTETSAPDHPTRLDPEPVREKITSRPPAEVTPSYREPNRNPVANNGIAAQPYSGDRYATSADRYTPPSRTPEVYPISTSDAPPPQVHYQTGGGNVASTGSISPAPGLQRDGDKYTIQPNDSFWNISERAYGSGAFFKALYEHNRKRHPESDEMKVGQTLSVPDESVLRRMYPDLCPKPRSQVPGVQQRLASASSRMRVNGRIYTVEDGDTLFEISRRELGKTARWGEIYDLNRDVLGNDFDYLHPGLELILPDDKQHSDTVTRQPGSVLPR